VAHLPLQLFRDYLYIPLGGTGFRPAKVFQCFSGHAPLWSLAWSKLDVRRMGRHPRPLSFGRPGDTRHQRSNPSGHRFEPAAKSPHGLEGTDHLSSVCFAWIFSEQPSLDALYIVSHLFVGWEDTAGQLASEDLSFR